jgi:hypothetical protein
MICGPEGMGGPRSEDDEMSKKCALLWHEANFQVSIGKH